MRLIIIGNSGTGKSTFSTKLKTVTNYPLLQLDSLWHTTDYSKKAKEWLIDEQLSFMKQKNWIIEGNYQGTLPIRIAQTDEIIWLKTTKLTAISRVIKRSIQFRINKQSRPEMPSTFHEKFDRDYWEFLKFIWSYNEKEMAQLILANKKPHAKIIQLKNSKEKQNYLQKWGK